MRLNKAKLKRILAFAGPLMLVGGMAFAQAPIVMAGGAEQVKPAINLNLAAVPARDSQTAVSCNLCFTCGGTWPVFAGSFAAASPNLGMERGVACVGTFAVIGDETPSLCCR